MKIASCILLALCAVWAQAGNNPALESARMDFKKINQAYAQAPGVSIKTYYKVFTDHASGSMIEGKAGDYVKFRENIYTKIDGIETYLIGDKVISINRDIRQIMVGDNRPAARPLQPDLDTLLTLCTNIRLEQPDAATKNYKLFFGDGGEFSRVDVLMDTRENRYRKITLYYAQEMNLQQDFYAEQRAPRLEITYADPVFLQEEPALFNSEHYILQADGKLKPAPAYYNFRIADLRSQTRIKTKHQPKTN